MNSSTVGPHEASALRRAIAEHLARIQEVAQVLQHRSPLLRGTVYENRVKCGKEGCRCQRGELHKRWLLSRAEEGRTVLYKVPSEKLAEWQRLTGEWRAYRKAVVELKRRLSEMIRVGERLARWREVGIEKRGGK